MIVDFPSLAAWCASMWPEAIGRNDLRERIAAQADQFPTGLPGGGR